MANKMLIDASHPEETRVVVLRGNRVEEFDFEAASRKQLRGNIYLAKVTRVEPSLQAAFVEYGGNRHGFLAFAEIHPDYYQIPVADRQALLEEEARAHSDESDDEQRGQRHSRRNRRNDNESAEKRRSGGDAVISEFATDAAPATDGEAPSATTDAAPDDAMAQAAPSSHDHASHDHASHDHASHDHESARETGEPAVQAGGDDIEPHASEDDGDAAVTVLNDHAEEAASGDAEQGGESQQGRGRDNGRRGRGRRDRNRRPGRDRDAASGKDEEGESENEADQVEQMGGDAMEEVPYRAPRLRRQYKIQEVIKRRQVLLIQVVKEERGNKGAALTTYLSLAGRYSVLMPNTARGGGISRKITDTGDRKRLKEIVQDLEVPEGMGIILRTAGASRTKAEVKRDFEYLLRMWETVRELTLKSSAPTLVYEEGSLIKRAIRDLYNKDIDEVIVAGEEGYREAKEFMRLLMPSHAKNVKLYRDLQPIFAKAGAEAQLDAMFSSQVTLKSGGYIVINQTEALVAIDVNSGRSTREHNIEDTAVRTNLEAADEVARQLRLRDLAGLIVVDFIDMDENRNNRSVERRMKDALANDRARIQVGRISHFGLLEMSRQRIRTGVLEGSTVPCPHCAGVGMVRSKSSIALHVMRVLEDALIKNASYNLILRTRTEVALYVLNQKRTHLRELETRFGVTLTIAADETLTGAVYHAMERGDQVLLPDGTPRPELVQVEISAPLDLEEEEAAIDEEVEAEEAAATERPAERQRQGRRHEGGRERGSRENGQRERGQRDGGHRDNGQQDNEQRGPESEGSEQLAARDSERTGERANEEGEQARRRRRRRRRRGGSERENVQNFAPGAAQPGDDGLEVLAHANGDLPGVDMADGTVVPRMDAASTEAVGNHHDAGTQTGEAAQSALADDSDPSAATKPRRSRRSKTAEISGETIAASARSEPESAEKPAKKPRRTAKSKEAVAEPIVTAALEDAPRQDAPRQSAARQSAPPAVPEPQPVEPPVVVRADPLPEAAPGPKRSGWWSRVKGAVSGGN